MALFKLPKKDKKPKTSGASGGLHTTLIMQGLRKLSGKGGAQIPIIGKLAPEKQITYTAFATLAFVLLTGALLGYSNYQGGFRGNRDGNANVVATHREGRSARGVG
jgi:hypothetical protein